MAKNKIVLLIFGLISWISSYSQGVISTPVKYEWKEGRKGEIKSSGNFVLRTASREWSASLDLLPMISNPQIRDSVIVSGRPFRILLSGRFPEIMPNLIPANTNEENFSMEVRIRILDSTLIRQVPFTISQSGNRNPGPPGAYGADVCVGRVNFLLELDPSRFGLSRAPWFWNGPFFVQIENGVVNKQ
jgi:hypothetical protein